MKARELWKVCRKLANEERLDVLRRVMITSVDEGLSVGQIADVSWIEPSDNLSRLFVQLSLA